MHATDVYKMHTKCTQNVLHILARTMHKKRVHHKNYVYNLYTKFIQNVSK